MSISFRLKSIRWLMLLKIIVPIAATLYVIIWDVEIPPDIVLTMLLYVPLAFWIGLFIISFTKYRWLRWTTIVAIVMASLDLIFSLLDLCHDAIGLDSCPYDPGTFICCPWGGVSLILSVLILPLLVSILIRGPSDSTA